MGIVLKQTAKNTTTTFLGFLFGAVNALFLYTNILEPEYFGLVTFILATSAILMPIFALGCHNTMVKYYSAQKEGSKDSFLTLIVLVPLALLFITALGIYIFYDPIAAFFSRKNTIVKDYVWHPFLVGLSMAYFEIFYAWSKVHLKSVFGNFLKEVFARAVITILLLLFYFEVISLDFFLNAIVGTYLLRTILMKLYAYSLRRPRLNFHFPENTKQILGYGLLMVIGGSVALVLLEIDKFMINQFISIDNVAYYGVAVYIATVIIVPTRAMHQITYPMTAEYLNTENYTELEKLYSQTSLTSFIASGILFLLIILNLNDLNLLLPEAYRGGFFIVLLIGLTKVFDSTLGNINAILYYSKYYKTVLFLGVLLAATTILLNVWLIPKYGIEGAAYASFIAIFLFNLIKLVFVKQKFAMLPYSARTFKILITLVFIGFLFWYLQFPFHPILNILFKSVLMIAMYLGILYRFDISEDVSGIMSKILRRRQ